MKKPKEPTPKNLYEAVIAYLSFMNEERRLQEQEQRPPEVPDDLAQACKRIVDQGTDKVLEAFKRGEFDA